MCVRACVTVHTYCYICLQSINPSLFPRTIYEKLGGVVTEEQRTLYAQRVEELVPSIRYCAYNIGDMPSDISQLIKLRTDAPGSDMLSSKIDVSSLAQHVVFFSHKR